MQINIPDTITNKKDLFSWLVTNKKMLISQKKSEIKRADAVYNTPVPVFKNENIQKTFGITKTIEDSDTLIQRVCVINTTNWYDSHGDVHIDGLWKKSLQENPVNYLVQEHDFSFKGIISEEVDARAIKYTWGEIGYSQLQGSTQALVFNTKIDSIRNPYMFEQYKLNRVRNHSVGMRYMDLMLAINDEDWKEEFAVWNKYYDRIANKEDVDDAGFFFAILQAKVIEGSAVVRGSNTATPTLNNKFQDADTFNDEPPNDGTQQRAPEDNWNLLTAINDTNFLNTIKTFI